MQIHATTLTVSKTLFFMRHPPDITILLFIIFSFQKAFKEDHKITDA
jgi:hypothetical protein